MLFPARPRNIPWFVSLSITPFHFSWSCKCPMCLLSLQPLFMYHCLRPCVCLDSCPSLWVFCKCPVIPDCLLMFNNEAIGSWLGAVCTWSCWRWCQYKQPHWAVSLGKFCPCFCSPRSRLRNKKYWYWNSETRKGRLPTTEALSSQLSLWVPGA